MSNTNFKNLVPRCHINYLIPDNRYAGNSYTASDYRNYPNEPPQNILGAEISVVYPTIYKEDAWQAGITNYVIYIGRKYNMYDLNRQLINRLEENDNIFDRLALEQLNEYKKTPNNFYVALTAMGLIQLGNNDDTVSTPEELKQMLDTIYNSFNSISFSIQPKEQNPHR